MLNLLWSLRTIEPRVVCPSNVQLIVAHRGYGLLSTEIYWTLFKNIGPKRDAVNDKLEELDD